MRFKVAGLFCLGIASFFFTLFTLEALDVHKWHGQSPRGNPKLLTQANILDDADKNRIHLKRLKNTDSHKLDTPATPFKITRWHDSTSKIFSRTAPNHSRGTTQPRMKAIKLPKHFEMKAPQSLMAKYIEHKKKLESQAKPTESTRAINKTIFQQAKLTEWDKMQISRRNKLRNVCEEISPMHHHWDIGTLSKNPHLLKNILVDDKNHLLFCYVPKVACTQWKRVMLNLTGITTTPLALPHYEAHNLAYQLSLDRPSFSAEDIKERLTAYKSVMFSRHPLERIFSAYRDKFEQNTPSSKIFIELHGKRMLEKIKRNMTYIEKSKMMSLTFKDMLEFLGVNPPAANQEHWKPAYHLCHPCTINYTYQGRFDDLFRDSTEILSRVLGSHRVEFPAVRPSLTSKLLIEYLADVPASIEHQFRKVFRLDYELFGYQ